MTQTARKVLIVEDERPLARALELKLSHEGFLAQIASNGEEALEIILGTNDIDLILLDLVMPKKDGFSVLETLKSKGIKIPVIVSSNLSQQEDLQKAKALGASDYFVKSDTPISEVVAHVKNLLKL